MSAHELRIEVLRALYQHGEQDLVSIHTLCNRPRTDISILPIVGKLVNDGLVEKVIAPRPASGPFPRRGVQPVPVRFRITDAGRKAVAS